MPTTANRDSSTKPGDLPAKWRKLLRRVPDYDPFRDAKGYWFDTDRAQLMLDFFPEVLQFVEGDVAGQPFKLEPWCQAIVANLFGWKRVGTDRRRYLEALVFVGKKNIKTTLGAGLVLAVLFCDGEARAQCYSAAAEREQAALAFEIAKLMVAADEDLSTRCKTYQKSIVVPEDGSFYKALSSEAYSKHGVNAHFVLSDELHAQPNRELIDVLKTSMASRSQPLIVHITTSDFERPGSICNETHDYASRVRDGIVKDPNFLPVIYEATIDDDWTKVRTWEKANPNIRKSVSIDYLRRQCKRAQDSPAYENTFKRLHLNIRTEQDVRWISMDKWRECVGDVDLEELAGMVCYGGLDLASTSDITALVLLFPIGERRVLLPFFWVPGEAARERDRRDRTTYCDWINEGLIRETPGNMTDYATVRREINELAETYNIRQLAVDRLFQGAQLANELGEQDGMDVIAFGQGFLSMAAPTLEFETLIKSGRLEHGGNPVLSWMASNVSVKLDDAGCMKPSKAKSTGKIDGIVSAIMAVGLASKHDETAGQSVYSERGLDSV